MFFKVSCTTAEIFVKYFGIYLIFLSNLDSMNYYMNCRFNVLTFIFIPYYD